jgi:hypothetical protein
MASTMFRIQYKETFSREGKRIWAWYRPEICTTYVHVFPLDIFLVSLRPLDFIFLCSGSKYTLLWLDQKMKRTLKIFVLGKSGAPH